MSRLPQYKFSLALPYIICQFRCFFSCFHFIICHNIVCSIINFYLLLFSSSLLFCLKINYNTKKNYCLFYLEICIILSYFFTILPQTHTQQLNTICFFFLFLLFHSLIPRLPQQTHPFTKSLCFLPVFLCFVMILYVCWYTYVHTYVCM